METRLLGVWRLVSFQAVGTDGSVAHPLGVGAIGQLIYDPSGRMSLHIVAPRVARFASDDRQSADDHEMCAAWQAYLGYCGAFHVDGPGKVTHEVEASWFPNLSGLPQRCRYLVEGDDRLTLYLPGEPEEVRLVWERFAS